MMLEYVVIKSCYDTCDPKFWEKTMMCVSCRPSLRYHLHQPESEQGPPCLFVSVSLKLVSISGLEIRDKQLSGTSGENKK